MQGGVIKCLIASSVTKPEENNEWSEVDEVDTINIKELFMLKNDLT